MKKILLLLFVVGLFCGCKFHEVPVTNSGTFTNSTITDALKIGVFEKQNTKQVQNIKNYYLSTDLNNIISDNTVEWSTDFPSIDNINKHLWNYQEIIYTDNTSDKTSPKLITTFNELKGDIKSIKIFYLTSKDDSNIKSLSGNWTSLIPTVTFNNESNKDEVDKIYLWEYKKITYKNINFDDFITYNGYNSSIDNIDLINSKEGCSTLKLYGGESSFEHIVFDFDKQTYLDSVNINFTDSFSTPMDNCCTVIMYYNGTAIKKSSFNYIYDSRFNDINDFSNEKNIKINQSVNHFELFFSSNNSIKGERLVEIHNISFIY